MKPADPPDFLDAPAAASEAALEELARRDPRRGQLRASASPFPFARRFSAGRWRYEISLTRRAEAKWTAPQNARH